jgi:hypothetical protein
MQLDTTIPKLHGEGDPVTRRRLSIWKRIQQMNQTIAVLKPKKLVAK